MSKEERDAALRLFIKKYGQHKQMNMCVEEMSELTKAIMKWHRSMTAFEAVEAKKSVVDELADVIIMCRQMEMIFDCFDEVSEKIDFKINRQLERLAAE